MKYFCLLMILCTLTSFAQNKANGDKCIEVHLGFLPKTTLDQHIITKQFVEIRFKCNRTAFLTSKLMYDQFGGWNLATQSQNKYGTKVLVWEAIDLFDDGKKYTIYTGGAETTKEMFASVMVVDELGADALADDAQNMKIIKYFVDSINYEDRNDKKFYKAYWTTFDPKNWAKIQKAQSLKLPTKRMFLNRTELNKVDTVWISYFCCRLATNFKDRNLHLIINPTFHQP